MKDFELPTNIRQIGGVDDHLRIYVEDYAVTYLKKFAESGGDSDRIAFLVGKHMVIDSQGYLFVCGAVQGKFSSYDEGNETFSDESYEYASSMMEKYFDGYEIVGWMQSQPGYGSNLNPVSADYHMNNFIKPYHVLLVIDPTEKLESFYAWDKAMNGMSEVKGYFVFYDRNRGMQEYMLDNKLSNIRGFSRGTVRGEDPEASKPAEPSAVRAGVRLARDRGTRGSSDAKPKSREDKGKPESPEFRRVINMLVGLSAALFVVCFIMGAGLLQSDNRLGELERDLSALNGSYGYVLGQINQLSVQMQNQAQAVFAPGDSQTQTQDQNNSAINNDNNIDSSSLGTEGRSQDEDALAARSPSPEPTPAMEIEQAPSAAPTPDPTAASTKIELPTATLPLSQTTVAIPTATPAAARTTAPQNGVISSLWAPPYDDEEYDEYIVQRGDNLSSICYNYYGTTEMIEKVMEVNQITQADMIYFGKVLLLPKVSQADQ